MYLPDKKEIVKQVKKALVKTLNVAADDIVLEGKLKDNYGLDSMASLTFLMTLEELVHGFAINPDSLEAEHLESVSSIVDYIEDELVNQVAS